MNQGIIIFLASEATLAREGLNESLKRTQKATSIYYTKATQYLKLTLVLKVKIHSTFAFLTRYARALFNNSDAKNQDFILTKT